MFRQGILWLCVTRPGNLQSGGMLRVNDEGKSRLGKSGICKHGMLSNPLVAACTPYDLTDVSWPLLRRDSSIIQSLHSANPAFFSFQVSKR